MHDINQSILYKLKSHKKLFTYLKTNKNNIKLLKKSKNYYEFIQKIKEKERNLIAPKDKLKIILKNIDHHLKKINTPSYLISNKKGLSSVDNANIHKNNNYILTLDIQNFFPSVNKEYIFRFFKYKLKQSDDIAWTLTKLVTIKEIDGVPQGFPTSARIAFWTYFKMFEEINNIVTKYNLTMTVYVDDITISGNNKINRLIYMQINNIVSKNGLQVKTSKTKLFGKKSPKHITGVVIKSKILYMPFDKFAKLRKLIDEDKIKGLLGYNKFISKFNKLK